MFKIIITLLISTVLLYSCESGTIGDGEKKDNMPVTIEDINTLEDELFNNQMGTPDIKKARQLLKLYTEYAKLYPKDSLSPNFLFKASDISMNVGNPKTTINLFNTILSQYPNYENIPTILFLKGFVYEDQLKDYDNAKKCYLEFLDTYPDNDFADDAAVSLNNLGKSPEELIKEFERENDSTE